MQIVWFGEFAPEPEADPVQAWAAALRGLEGLAYALAHTPVEAHDPFLHRDAPPALVLQLYFDTLEALDAALSPAGTIARRAQRHPVREQAMAVRRCAVPYPGDDMWQERCTYLVAYEGPADDYDAWLGHYLGTHAVHLTQLPGVRDVEVYTRIDWCSGLPGTRRQHMQRNKVVFDSPDALSLALASPVRARMREDFVRFPAFHGAVTHHALRTARIAPHFG